MVDISILFLWFRNQLTSLGGTTLYGNSCEGPTKVLGKVFPRLLEALKVGIQPLSPRGYVYDTQLPSSKRYGKSCRLLSRDIDMENPPFVDHVP